MSGGTGKTRDSPVILRIEYPGVCVTGGEGVGIVTKKGLSCPVGHHAINPVPREMILEAAFEARCRYGRPDERITIEISIPEGKELAGRMAQPCTGNNRRDIRAWHYRNRESDERECAARDDTPGYQSQGFGGQENIGGSPRKLRGTFSREEFGLDMSSFVECSNYMEIPSV